MARALLLTLICRRNYMCTTTKQRIIWLDCAKGIAMVFIVLSHCGAPELYNKIYTPFFLTTFFFASGYTFSPKENYKKYFIHKIKTLLLPYFCLGTINAILAFIADGDNLMERMEGLLFSINGHNDDLWFVMCLFSMQFFFYFIWRVFLSKAEGGEYYIILAMVSAGIMMLSGYALIFLHIAPLPFQLETALIMTPFMLVGYLYRRCSDKSKMLKGGGGILIVISYFFLVLLFDNTVNIHREMYTNFWLFIAAAMLGIWMIVFLSQQIAIKIDTLIVRGIVFIGQNTLVYYAFQSKAIRLLDVVYVHLPFSMNAYVRSLLYTLFVCSILAVPAIVINRCFPFLLGRSYAKQWKKV